MDLLLVIPVLSSSCRNQKYFAKTDKPNYALTGGVSTFRPCFGNPPTGPKNALKCFSSIAMHCLQLVQQLPLSSQKLVLMFCPTYKPLKIMPFAWQVYTFCSCLCHTLDHATAAQRQTALPPRPVVGLRVIPRAFPLV